MTKEGLCPSCVHSVWCPTWAEYKCLEKKDSVYAMTIPIC